MKGILCTAMSFVFFFLYQNLFAQSEIHGIIKDANEKPIQFANVLLLKSTDSLLVKGMISDAAGKYMFQNIKTGNYIISVSFTGREQKFTSLIEITPEKKEVNMQTTYLESSAVQLSAVKVDAKKPMFEQKIDRMVINVKNSITNAGGTALDVLEKSPGVTVDRQNNAIAINGKNGVVVMINGKITYMPMDALVQLLAGISAGNIEKIELITTPPAKYDAEGNAGYINIVLLNNPNRGANGSYFLTAGYGNKELGAAGINFNYRTTKINLYGNYNFNYDHVIQTGGGFTQLTKSGNIIANTSFSNRDAVRQVHNVRIGLDYQLDSSTIIGALISGYDNNWKMTANNGASIKQNGVLDTTINTIDKEINHWQNIMTNLNFQHTFKPGQVLFFDANYIYYKDNNPNTYSNIYYQGSGEYLYNENIRSGKVTPINIKVLSSDYTTPLGKKISMEAGAKVSLSKFTNDVSVENLQGGEWHTDSTLSANYLLKENIGAAYTSFTMEVNSKITVKAGLRYEYTSSNLGTTQTANIVNRKYGQLFPTFYISKKINDDNSMNFSYSRRITRPTFNDLAPFTIFFDPKTFFTGNPALQPAIANSLQASYIFKNYIVSLSYTHEDNTIESFQTDRIDTVSNVVYLSAKNFKYEQYVTASFSLPFTITKWWSIQNNINFDWRQLNTVYNNTAVQLALYDYNINSTQRFTLPKDFSIELTGFYSSASYFGSGKLKPLYQVDAGLQKKFSNKKDILRFAANDIFNSGSNYRFVEEIPIEGTILRGSLNFGMVAYKLTYTHNFGNKSLRGKRDRSTGAEDELNRVHN
ncbi:MAG TPA: outer membrane beta-barrel family protein [Ginsengibacter sp.]